MKRRDQFMAMTHALGLLSDYETTDHEAIDKVANQVKETSIEKVAGIYIDKPTPENIEEFLRRYMYNELSFFPRVLDVTVKFIPSTFDTVRKDQVEQGTGLVQINVRGVVVELPFLVNQGELVPFDIIQMEGQRVPYSRDNLQKILVNLDRQIEQEQAVGGEGQDSPYAGLENYSNPSTAPGFMGDVLSIRDSQSLKRGPGMYVTAMTEADDIEKGAGFFSKTPDQLMKKIGNGESVKVTEKNNKLYAELPNGKRRRIDDRHPMDKDSLDRMRETKQDNGDGTFNVGSISKSAGEDDFLGLGLFSKDRRNNLEGQVDKAREKIESEKPTTKAPKGTVEKEKEEEEKVAYRIIDLNELLEKAASIRPITEEECAAIATVINKTASSVQEKKFEKLASEDTELTRKEKENLEKMQNIKFVDAASLPHGEFIVFPEINGKEVSLTPAVVLSDIDSEISPSNFKFVCAFDGRIKVLGGEPFICRKAPDKVFKLPTSRLKTVENNDRFFAIKGNKVIAPIEVEYISHMVLGKSNGFSFGDDSNINHIAKTYCGKTLDYSGSKGLFFRDKADKNAKWEKGRLEISTLDGKKFEKINVQDFITEKAEEVALTPQMIDSLLPYNIKNSKEVVVSDPETQIIKITGMITNNFKSQKEFETKNQLHDAGYDVEKVAFALNTITVTCMDRKQGLFNLVVEYKDAEQRFMSLRRQDFNRIGQGKLKAILRILKFEASKVQEIVFKAKNEPRAIYPIPTNCTIDDIKQIQGGNLTNVSTEAVKNTFKKYVNPLDIAKTLTGATAGALVTKSIIQGINSSNIGSTGTKVIGTLAKMANESADLSAKFEKLAQEHENDVMLDYAKVLATSHYLHEKIAMVIDDNRNSYPCIKEVASDIVSAKPVLEKFAYDLTGLKVNQTISGREIIDTNTISRAITNIDSLYKTAYALNELIDNEKLSFIK